ncbi:hypothetical protein BO70DRAFT_320362 [Aspergillus heteromorphus CBS 117.55]|uniref:Protein kinase domain-containing protein n=1 Tax=Aspergillus heteromorphus CBS 117.55 TaxID=1448321 RepID=A0A317VIG6_9EURO|nr:uncharacterized protein BO70DRAFT_320362 [Aspergillus heteromorphus CBS 117.55]PWY73021.1 hypothetical protein BO70DRAFT_320362 [Aspergillus heteromorphus CBS 117.55]
MDPVTAAGLALAVPGLAFQAFAGCVQGFVILSTAHNFGKDATFLRTILNVEEYRFVQWADAVGLTATEGRMSPRINHVLAEELLVHLKDRLDSSKLKQRYSLDLRPAESSVQGTTGDIKVDPEAPDVLAKAVSHGRRAEIIERARLIQGRTQFPKRLWWAVIDKTKFQDLILDVRQIVDSLWNLLEPVRLRELSQQVGQTLTAVVDMSHDLEALKGLQASFTGKHVKLPEDAILSAAVDLKVVREQLPGESTRDSDPIPLYSAGPEPLKPLNRSFLKRASGTRGARGTFIAEYDGKPVLCETKVVHGRMKSKLRLRSENLARLLSLPKGPSFMTLQCLGFVEDMDEFVFLYDYPPGSDLSAPPRSLQDLLRDSKMKLPSATARLKLALEICSTLLTVHTSGWLHKNIRSENILFFTPCHPCATIAALPQPYLTGFTFARADSPIEISDQASEDPLSDIYRHPEALGEPSMSYAMCMDLYSLGAVMVEIAEWRPLKHIIKRHVDVGKKDVDISISALAGTRNWLLHEFVDRGQVEFRMGDVYGGGVSRFLRSEPKETDNGSSTSDLLAFQRFVHELSLCCV